MEMQVAFFMLFTQDCEVAYHLQFYISYFLRRWQRLRHMTHPRLRILKLRYSHGVLLLIWRYYISLYGLVKTLYFLPIVSISVK